MFRYTIKFGLVAVVAVASSAAFADPDCTCRFNGQDIPEGQMICMNLPSGDVLAQCGRVLNNTAWKTIQKGCPYSAIELSADTNQPS